MDDINNYLNPTEFARRVKVHRETVRRRILEGKLPVIRIGSLYFIAPEEVRRYKRGTPGRPRGSKSSRRFTRQRRTT